MWKVGDRAVVVNCPNWDFCGEIVQLVRQVRPEEFGLKYAGEWVLDIPPPPGHPYSCCKEKYLRHLPDDDHKRFHQALIAGKWSDCEWNPMAEIEQ